MGQYRHVPLVLLLGVVLTAVLFKFVQDQQQARTQEEFERQVETYVAAIRKGIERNLEVLDSIEGLYAASSKVERDDFLRFVQGPLSRHQEIQALSWNERVTHSERRQFEDSLRQEGYPEFQFKDLRDGQRVVAIERPEYIVVTYIEPYEGNQAALGLDVASNPTRLAALESARDTGEIIATARITLVQETGNQYGFLILKPIYKTPAAPETVERRRQYLKGFAVGVFRIGDMVEAALEKLPEGIVNIQLVDGASPADEGLLYLSQASDINTPAEEEQLKARGELYMREPLEIPGRQWSVLITPTSEFFIGQAAWQTWGVLAGGLTITALLIAYLITIINHGVKTQGLAAELTLVNEGLETEIIERKLAEGALRDSETRFRQLFDDAPVGYAEIDVHGTITRVNSTELELLGYAAGEVVGHSPMEFVLDQEREASLNNFNRLMAGEVEGLTVERTFRRKEGSTIAVVLEIRPLHDDIGRVVGFRRIMQDITERKQAEAQIKASLKEKEVLLREIHHRVKNNLQIISSLLNLQSRYIKDKETLDIFSESQNRVRSLALIHEKLYLSRDLARIDFGEYLRSLVANLLRSYGVDSNLTTVKIIADDVFLDIDTAIPCGLIINELVSNSLKHAFSAGKDGEIGIDFRVDNDNKFILAVRDNGVGLPRDFDFQNTESFGLQLVMSLASDQLGGTIELDSSSGGAGFKMEFAALQPA